MVSTTPLLRSVRRAGALITNAGIREDRGQSSEGLGRRSSRTRITAFEKAGGERPSEDQARERSCGPVIALVM